jgi:hypothetical protein
VCAQNRILRSNSTLILLSRCSDKNKSLLFFRNLWHLSRHPTPRRGAARDRHERWRWDAVDAKRRRAVVIAGRVSCERSTGTQTNGAFAYGEVVWSWHPLLMLSPRGGTLGPTGISRCHSICRATVAKRNSSPGRSRITRKTIAWGMPDVSGASAVNTRAHTLSTPARTRLRVHWAPGIPRALCFHRAKDFRH